MTKKKALRHSVKIIEGLFQKLLVDSLSNLDFIKSIFLDIFDSQEFSIWILSFFYKFHLTVRVIWMIVIQFNVAAPLKLFSDFDFCQKCFIWLVFSLQSHFIAGLIISKLLDGTRAPPLVLLILRLPGNEFGKVKMEQHTFKNVNNC